MLFTIREISSTTKDNGKSFRASLWIVRRKHNQEKTNFTRRTTANHAVEILLCIMQAWLNITRLQQMQWGWTQTIRRGKASGTINYFCNNSAYQITPKLSGTHALILVDL